MIIVCSIIIPVFIVETKKKTIKYISYEKVSFLEMRFLLDDAHSKNNIKINIKFNDINSFDIKQIGGSYNQISGFEIVDQRECGWEMSHRYLIRDFEDDKINFYCRSVEVIDVEEIFL